MTRLNRGFWVAVALAMIAFWAREAAPAVIEFAQEEPLSMDVILAIIGSVIAMLLGILGWSLKEVYKNISETLKELTESVRELNRNLAVVITEQSNHERRITRLEERK